MNLPMTPRVSAAEQKHMLAMADGTEARLRADSPMIADIWMAVETSRVRDLLLDLADREADTTRFADENADLRAERDRLADALAEREKDVGQVWCAGRDAAAAVADQRWLETEAIRSMRGITMGDVSTARERGRAYSTVAAAIRALTPPAGTPSRPCAFPCQWMPNADPAATPRICAHCGREEPGPGATRATDGMEDGDG